MPRKLTVAAVQMDATPAPTTDRLELAADLIVEAASSGAQLIVLPELFNTGYEYHDRNYALAETLDGVTVTWMKAQAQHQHIHIAGSLLLRDGDEIYNAALLVAPDGKVWRYDKLYPWNWERTYFRPGNGDITVADTELGKLGMMICWDAAHTDLWRRYAGKVDAMLVISSPPKLSSADLVFPDGLRVNSRELGGLLSGVYTDEEYFPGVDMDEQTAWLGVPVIATVGGETFRSKMPHPYVSVASYLLARPDLWSRVPQAADVRLETGFDRQTKVISAAGEVLARVNEDGDRFTIAQVELADETPSASTQPQPPMRTLGIVYFISDIFGPALTAPLYKRAVKPQPEGMSPLVKALLVALVIFGIMRLLGAGKRRDKRR